MPTGPSKAFTATHRPLTPPPAFAAVRANLLMPPESAPSAALPLLINVITGPMDAAISAMRMIVLRSAASMALSLSRKSLAPEIRSRMVGFRSSPNACATSTALFLRLVSLLAVVEYRLLASAVRAVFSFQALSAMSRALLNKSTALTERSSVSRSRISEMPMSLSVATADMPSSSICASPLMNAINASAGLDFHSA